MKKILIATVVFLSIFSNLSAQNERLNDYSFVIVPRQFTFQFEQDQYQLNSLLKFLFNKHGFHAFFENELPNVNRCEGLWAELEGENGFIWNEVRIVLKDCDGVVMFKSITGKSKLKEYSKSYSEAIRESFLGIEALGVRQKELVMLSEGEVSSNQNTSRGKSNEVKKMKDPLNLPSESFTSYVQGSANFVLRKTNQGYNLYQEHVDAEEGLSYIGKIFVVDKQAYFEDATEVRYIATFDENGNILLDREGQKIFYSRN